MATDTLFDAYMMVDWSANSTPKRGRDSIWYCHLRRTRRGLRRVALRNPPTRAQALDEIRQRLASRKERVLVGFDFPNAYPRGFAAKAGFGSTWQGVWRGIDALIQDAADNRNNRFRAAVELNRRISGRAFPFWGCPAGQADALLSPYKPLGYDGLPEKRYCEAYLPSAQPCWKLAYNGSVGSQALLGIPVQRALREDALLQPARVWPFETGLRAARDGRIVLAEVYPSIIKVEPKPGEIKDAVQVQSIARCLARRDEQGALAGDLRGPDTLSAAQRAVVENHEGWILGAGTLGKSATRLLRD